MDDRRSFLKKSGALTAGSFLLNYCGPIQPVKRNIGIQLYTLRDLIEKDVVDTLTKTARIGYKEIEIHDTANGKYFGMAPKQFSKLLNSLDMSVVSGHYGSGVTAPEMTGTLTNSWEQSVEAMAEVGQKYAVIAWLAPAERASLDDYKRLADLINPAAEKCKAAGIQLCYHNHEFEFQELDGEIPMYYLLDNTSSDALKMELDLYWITKAKFDPLAFFKKYPGRIPLWHVKDMAADGDFAEVGNGTIDFKTIFGQQELAGMKHFFVEQDKSDNPLNSVTESYKYVSENLV